MTYSDILMAKVRKINEKEGNFEYFLYFRTQNFIEYR